MRKLFHFTPHLAFALIAIGGGLFVWWHS